MVLGPGQRFVDPDYIKQRKMKYCPIFLAFLLTCGLDSKTTLAEEKKDLGTQFAENPPMQVISKTPPAPPAIEETFEIREGFTVIDTTVERLRGCLQLLCVGDATLENVTVLEAGDFSYDLSAGDKGKVVIKNCRGDIAYNPLFNLTRGAVPRDAFYEVTILSPAEEIQPTARTSLGTICGDNCTFILRDGTTRPLPTDVNHLNCGGKKGLQKSTLTNYTTARLILNERVRNCMVKSVGSVEDHGRQNTIIRIEPETTAD